MSDWSNYKDKVRKNNPDAAKHIDEAEEISAIVGAMIEQRHNMNLSQRELAQLFHIHLSLELSQELQHLIWQLYLRFLSNLTLHLLSNQVLELVELVNRE